MFELDPNDVNEITDFVSSFGAEESDALSPGSKWKSYIPHFFAGIAALAILFAIVSFIYAIVKN